MKNSANNLSSITAEKTVAMFSKLEGGGVPLLFLGFGLSLFYCGYLLQDYGGNLDVTVYSSVAVYIFLSLFYWRQPLSIPSLAAASSVAFALFLVVYVLSFFVSQQTAIALEVVHSSLRGITSALLFTAFFLLLARQKFTHSIALLAIMAIATSAVLLVFASNATTKAVVSIVCWILSSVCLHSCIKAGGVTPVPSRQKNDAPSTHAEKHDGSFAYDFSIMLASCVLFPQSYSILLGFISSQPISLYGPIGTILPLSGLIAVTAFFVFRRTSFDNNGVLILVTIIYALGCLLLPLYWNEGGHFVGSLILKLGYSVFQVCLWAHIVQMSQQHSDHSIVIICLPLALSILEHGLLLSGWLLQITSPSSLDIESLAFAVLFALVIFSSALYLVERAKWRKVARQQAYGASARTPQDSPHAAVEESESEFLDFQIKFLKFCGDERFTEQERRALVQLVRGYSIEAIGRHLGYSRDGAKLILTKIYSKVGVSNKQDLIRLIEEQEDPSFS